MEEAAGRGAARAVLRAGADEPQRTWSVRKTLKPPRTRSVRVSRDAG